MSGYYSPLTSGALPPPWKLNSQTFNPSVQNFPSQTLNSSAQTFNPSVQNFPSQTFNPSAQTFNPPSQNFNPSAQNFPSQTFNPSAQNFSSQKFNRSLSYQLINPSRILDSLPMFFNPLSMHIFRPEFQSSETVICRGGSYEYSASGEHLDVEKIRKVLMENGIVDIFTETTPRGKSIKVQIHNPTQRQIQIIKSELNTSNIFSQLQSLPEKEESTVTIEDVTDDESSF